MKQKPKTTSRGGGRVLLVSADKALAVTLEHMLAGSVWLLTRAEDAASALALLPDSDVCLLDAWMPTALSLLVRARDGRVQTPILWLGSDDELTSSAVIGAGAVECIPLDILDRPLLERSLRYAHERTAVNRDLDQAEQELAESVRSMRHLIADFRDALLVLDPSGLARYANPAAERLFCGNPVGKVYPSLMMGEDGLYELQMDIAGEVRTVEAQLSTTCWEGESAVLASVRDVTQRCLLEDRFRTAQFALDAAITSIALVDARQAGYPLVYVNLAFEDMVGVPASRLLGERCPLIYAPDIDQSTRVVILDALTTGEPCHVQFRASRPDGTSFWDEMRLAPVRDMDGQVTHFVGFHNDISAQIEACDQLQWQSEHHSLCGLPNRYGLVRRIGTLFAEGRSTGEWMTVLSLKIDDFHAVNDTYGHHVGDTVILLAARRLREFADANVLAVRVGGAEFLVAVTALHDPEVAMDYTRRIRAALSAPYAVGGMSIALQWSAGVCLDDGTAMDGMALVRNADIAMRRAHECLAEGVGLFRPEMAERMMRNIHLQSELQSAIELGEFITLYQPQIEAHSGRIVGVEALVRWRHPTRGLLVPEQFLPVAEDTGQILAIGAAVLQQACLDAVAARAAGLPEFLVSVNFTSREFFGDGFMESVETALSLSGLRADRLEIELTHASLSDESEEAKRRFDTLRRMGVRLAIDNFGRGGFDLSSLRHLPATKLKIDQGFTCDAMQDARAAAIIQGVVSMAHHLDMTVVAEGVESEPQRDFLRKIGCDLFQGFWVAQPMPWAALEDWLRQRQVDQSALAVVPAEGVPPTLLLLDDEPNILRALSRLLRRDGYRIFTANSAREAFAILASNEVHVIISDQRMPEMCGTEFLAQVKDLYPDTIRIVLSGYTDLKSVTDAINQGAIYRFLTKPWNDDELRENVRKAFAGRLHRQAADPGGQTT